MREEPSFNFYVSLQLTTYYVRYTERNQSKCNNSNSFPYTVYICKNLNMNFIKHILVLIDSNMHYQILDYLLTNLPLKPTYMMESIVISENATKTTC